MPLAIARDEDIQADRSWMAARVPHAHGPPIPADSERFGFAPEVEALLAANANGGPPRLPTEAERLAQDVIVMGTYDEAPSVVRLWLEAGADTIDLVLPIAVPEQQLREMLEAAAPAATASAGERTPASRASVGDSTPAKRSIGNRNRRS